ncbi:head-tail connector protein, partial [Bacillus haynesii]
MNLVDMKNYLRLDHSEDDEMLSQFI